MSKPVVYTRHDLTESCVQQDVPRLSLLCNEKCGSYEATFDSTDGVLTLRCTECSTEGHVAVAWTHEELSN